jgi:hypothetical protein
MYRSLAKLSILLILGKAIDFTDPFCNNNAPMLKEDGRVRKIKNKRLRREEHKTGGGKGKEEI